MSNSLVSTFFSLNTYLSFKARGIWLALFIAFSFVTFYANDLRITIRAFQAAYGGFLLAFAVAELAQSFAESTSKTFFLEILSEICRIGALVLLSQFPALWISSYIAQRRVRFVLRVSVLAVFLTPVSVSVFLLIRARRHLIDDGAGADAFYALYFRIGCAGEAAAAAALVLGVLLPLFPNPKSFIFFGIDAMPDGSINHAQEKQSRFDQIYQQDIPRSPVTHESKGTSPRATSGSAHPSPGRLYRSDSTLQQIFTSQTSTRADTHRLSLPASEGSQPYGDSESLKRAPSGGFVTPQGSLTDPVPSEPRRITRALECVAFFISFRYSTFCKFYQTRRLFLRSIFFTMGLLAFMTLQLFEDPHTGGLMASLCSFLCFALICYAYWTLLTSNCERTPSMLLSLPTSSKLFNLASKVIEDTPALVLMFQIAIFSRLVSTGRILGSELELLHAAKDMLTGINPTRATSNIKEILSSISDSLTVDLTKPRNTRTPETTTAPTASTGSEVLTNLSDSLREVRATLRPIAQRKLTAAPTGLHTITEEHTTQSNPPTNVSGYFHPTCSSPDFAPGGKTIIDLSQKEFSQLPAAAQRWSRFWCGAADKFINDVQANVSPHWEHIHTFMDGLSSDTAREIFLYISKTIMKKFKRERFLDPSLVHDSALASCTFLEAAVCSIINGFPHGNRFSLLNHAVARILALCNKTRFRFGNFCDANRLVSAANLLSASLVFYDALIEDVCSVLRFRCFGFSEEALRSAFNDLDNSVLGYILARGEIVDSMQDKINHVHKLLIGATCETGCGQFGVDSDASISGLCKIGSCGNFAQGNDFAAALCTSSSSKQTHPHLMRLGSSVSSKFLEDLSDLAFNNELVLNPNEMVLSGQLSSDRELTDFCNLEDESVKLQAVTPENSLASTDDNEYTVPTVLDSVNADGFAFPSASTQESEEGSETRRRIPRGRDKLFSLRKVREVDLFFNNFRDDMKDLSRKLLQTNDKTTVPTQSVSCSSEFSTDSLRMNSRRSRTQSRSDLLSSIITDHTSLDDSQTISLVEGDIVHISGANSSFSTPTLELSFSTTHDTSQFGFLAAITSQYSSGTARGVVQKYTFLDEYSSFSGPPRTSPASLFNPPTRAEMRAAWDTIGLPKTPETASVENSSRTFDPEWGLFGYETETMLTISESRPSYTVCAGDEDTDTGTGAGSNTSQRNAAETRDILVAAQSPMSVMQPRCRRVLDSWSADIMELNHSTSQHALFFVAVSIHIEEPTLFPSVLKPFSFERFAAFLLMAERGYNANPYHSAVHAADALQFAYKILKEFRATATENHRRPAHTPARAAPARASVVPRTGVPWGDALLLVGARTFSHRDAAVRRSERQRFPSEKAFDAWLPRPLCALLLLAVILHDVDHPGYNNAFLRECRHPLANMYNNNSILEAHSASVGLDLLRHCGFHTTRRFRECLRGIILATDMTFHFHILSCMQSLCEALEADAGLKAQLLADLPRLGPFHTCDVLRTPAGLNAKGTASLAARARTLLVFSVMKIADVNNQLRPFRIARKWSEAMQEEFFNHGDHFKNMGLEPDKSGDRSRRSGPYLAAGQVGFITFVVLPFQNAFQRVASCVLGVPGNHFASAWSLTDTLRVWKRVAAAPGPEEE